MRLRNSCRACVHLVPGMNLNAGLEFLQHSLLCLQANFFIVSPNALATVRSSVAHNAVDNVFPVCVVAKIVTKAVSEDI